MNKNDALIDLCRAFLQDVKVVSQAGWKKLVLVGEVGDTGVRIFGYSYNAQGECKLISPSLDFDTQKLEVLHKDMKSENPNGRSWLKCMIRISSEGEVGADFEYNDPDRWSHTPDNYKQRIAEYAAMPV